MEPVYTVPLYLKEKVKHLIHNEIDHNAEVKCWKIIAIIGWLLFFLMLGLYFFPDLEAKEINLTASWYFIQSLKTEGTYKYWKGRMANGKIFDENALTCACRLYPLGSLLRITNAKNGKSVIVLVTDRIGKRFAKTRIDLAMAAFAKIADLEQGLVPVKVEVLK